MGQSHEIGISFVISGVTEIHTINELIARGNRAYGIGINRSCFCCITPKSFFRFRITNIQIHAQFIRCIIKFLITQRFQNRNIFGKFKRFDKIVFTERNTKTKSLFRLFCRLTGNLPVTALFH